MSTRLASGGRLIDRRRNIEFKFNGRRFRGLQGDTLASALLANNQILIGRSFKYHRRRGIVSSGVEDPNALVSVGEGDRLVPNQRATSTELIDGMAVRSQNHWPSLEFDIGTTANFLARMLPAGFYYKTFIQPRAAWKNLFEPLIRQTAGLGQAPKETDPDRYEHFNVNVDVLVVGGGVSGLIAAERAARSKASVLLIEQTVEWGGRSTVDGVMIDDQTANAWVKGTLSRLQGYGGANLLLRTTAIGIYDHGYVVALQRCAPTSEDGSPLRMRLWRIRARKVVLATGAIERSICFRGNDVPGVMLASAVRDYVLNYGVSPGDRTVIVTNNDDAYRTAIALAEAGLNVPAILDVRPIVEGDLPGKARKMGVEIKPGKAVGAVIGRRRVTGVSICSQAGEGSVLETLDCDVVAMSGGWSPTVHLWGHCGGKLDWDESGGYFRPDTGRPPINADGNAMVHVVGAADGELHAGSIPGNVEDRLKKTISEIGLRPTRAGLPKVAAPEDAQMLPVWLMPQGMKEAARSKSWIDFQNDVKVSDIDLAAREGYESVEHTKRYTTLGMGTDQGKISNINGLVILSGILNKPVPEVGTTTFRPPYTAVTLGAIAGEARGPHLFRPVRKTPIDSWHEERSAYWEPVGDWRRPYCYPGEGESVEKAVERESLRVRRTVGMLDASTLGKLLVQGPDAGKFLDMLYTNMMSSLPVGRCRYGLMCNENGFLMDDGVVARLGENEFLCHTTTGGADHIHAWMEEWLQTEWWNWKVYTANLTDQFAQIAVAGPDARKVVEKIGGLGLDSDSLPFMRWTPVQFGKFDAHIFRISFTGELSFEISVPASQGLELWETLLDAGQAFDIEPFGTEAMHLLRAEKGFIMIGDETDGTVIPQDLGLNWAISSKKADFLGKRAQQRIAQTDSNRWQLVGLEPLESRAKLTTGSHALSDELSEFGHPRMIGRVTSSYFSPIMNRTIGMGLVERGPERKGEILEFLVGKEQVKVRIVDHVFYDKEGTQLHA